MDKVTLNLSSRWKRLGGVIVDILVMMVIAVPVIMMSYGPYVRMLEKATTLSQQIFIAIIGKIVFMIIGCVIFLILNGYLLIYRGQTIGKVVVKTKIVDVNGGVPNFGKLLFFRYLIIGLVGQIPIVGVLCLADPLFIFGKERRCIHDYMAGTWVVNAL